MAPGLAGWQVLLDPARPNWPGCLVVANEFGNGFIQVTAGSPPDFDSSRELAESIARMLNMKDALRPT